jgi:serine/threonine-protein kinase
VWSPDGEWIYFSSNKGDSYDLFKVAADGSEQPVQLTDDEFNQFPNSIAPDGKTLVYTQVNKETAQDLMMMPLEGNGEPETFLSTSFMEYGGKVSPDGKWLVYGSNESGDWEVYVRPFPEGRGEWRISDSRSAHPRWSSKGDEIFYRSALGIAGAAVEIQGDTFRAKRPEALFDGNFVALFPSYDFDVAPGGESFVLFKGVDSSEIVDHVVLITNWFPKLEETFAAAP